MRGAGHPRMALTAPLPPRCRAGAAVATSTSGAGIRGETMLSSRCAEAWRGQPRLPQTAQSHPRYHSTRIPPPLRNVDDGQTLLDGDPYAATRPPRRRPPGGPPRARDESVALSRQWPRSATPPTRATGHPLGYLPNHPLLRARPPLLAHQTARTHTRPPPACPPREPSDRDLATPAASGRPSPAGGMRGSTPQRRAA